LISVGNFHIIVIITAHAAEDIQVESFLPLEGVLDSFTDDFTITITFRPPGWGNDNNNFWLPPGWALLSKSNISNQGPESWLRTSPSQKI
jgi:hypothetical protein